MISRRETFLGTSRNIVLGVSGAGTPAGDALIGRLRTGGFPGRIVALAHELRRGSPAADFSPHHTALIPRPSRGWEIYRSRLVDARRRFGMEAMISADEAEIPMLVRFQGILADDGIRTFLPSPGQYSLCDRDKLAVLATRIDTATPRTWRLRSHSDLFKAWADCPKPAILMNSAGRAHRVERFDEAAFLFEEIAFEHGGIVLLRSAPGECAIVSSGVGNGEGRLAGLSIESVCRDRTIPAETLREIRYVSENFTHLMRWRGSFRLTFTANDDTLTIHGLDAAPADLGLAPDDAANLPLALANLLTREAYDTAPSRCAPVLQDVLAA